MNFKITETRKEWDLFTLGVKELSGQAIRVGIFGDKAAARPKGSKATVGEYANYNEYGTKSIPERSFFRSTLSKNEEKYFELMDKVADAVLRGKKGADIGLIGRKVSSDIRQTIQKLKTPPNAPSTIERKKSNNPLINKGNMRRAVSWEVE